MRRDARSIEDLDYRKLQALAKVRYSGISRSETLLAGLRQVVLTVTTSVAGIRDQVKSTEDGSSGSNIDRFQKHVS